MRIFLEAGVELPLPTLLLHRLSELLRHQWGWLAAAGAALAFGARAALRMPSGRRALDAWVLGLPVIGPLVNKVVLCRFARTLETLVSSGVPILESLAIVEQTAGNVVIGGVVKQMHANVRQGGSLSDPLKASSHIPPMAAQMIQVGEASGTLDHMLKKLAEHYELLVRHGIVRATAFIEPVFLMVMGGMVAFIMASVLLPMFRLVNVIRH
jgi:type IV pilus assembly protein PilC